MVQLEKKTHTDLNKTILWTAIVTPMNQDKKIDFKSFELLLKQQEEANNGVVLLGSTGEGLALTEIEKREILTFATSLKLKIPLCAGVGGFLLDQVLDYLKFCETLPLHAYLVVTPIYSKPGPKGQCLWFKTILDSVSRPCMLYNIPGRAGVALSTQVLTALKDHPLLWSVKESSGSINQFEQFRMMANTISFYCGDDGLMPYFAQAGAIGLVSVMSNVWPKETHLYVEKSLKGENLKSFPLWQKASALLMCVSNPIPTKILLKELGLISSSTLRLPLSATELEKYDELLKIDHEIKHWFKNA